MSIRSKAAKVASGLFTSLGVLGLIATPVITSATLVTTSAQIQGFSLVNPAIHFQVVNQDTIVNVTNSAPQSGSANLAFARFDGGLGTLTGVSITYTTTYGVTSAVQIIRAAPLDVGTTTFFADGSFHLSLTGAGLIPAQLLNDVADAAASSTCTSTISINEGKPVCTIQPGTGPVSNNGNFNGTASGGPLASFVGSGSFNLTATLLSDLAPRVSPDNGTGYADNATFDGSLDSAWNGSVSLAYTYDDAPPATIDIPEPISIYLVLAGLGGLAFWKRRRAPG